MSVYIQYVTLTVDKELSLVQEQVSWGQVHAQQNNGGVSE